jgi:hypothetical protein
VGRVMNWRIERRDIPSEVEDEDGEEEQKEEPSNPGSSDQRIVIIRSDARVQEHLISDHGPECDDPPTRTATRASLG